MASGRFEEHRDEQRGADAPALEQGEADDRRLRDAVEDDAEHDRKCRAGLPLSLHALPARATHAIDDLVADEEREGPGGEAEGDAGATAGRERLFDELVGNRADQHAGAEGHDQPKEPVADADAQDEQPAEEKRGEAASRPQPKAAPIQPPSRTMQRKPR